MLLFLHLLSIDFSLIYRLLTIALTEPNRFLLSLSLSLSLFFSPSFALSLFSCRLIELIELLSSFSLMTLTRIALHCTYIYIYIYIYLYILIFTFLYLFHSFGCKWWVSGSSWNWIWIWIEIEFIWIHFNVRIGFQFSRWSELVSNWGSNGSRVRVHLHNLASFAYIGIHLHIFWTCWLVAVSSLHRYILPI